VQHHYLDDDAIDVRVEQGFSIGRPSLLHLRAMRTSRASKCASAAESSTSPTVP